MSMAWALGSSIMISPVGAVGEGHSRRWDWESSCLQMDSPLLPGCVPVLHPGLWFTVREMVLHLVLPPFSSSTLDELLALVSVFSGSLMHNAYHTTSTAYNRGSCTCRKDCFMEDINDAVSRGCCRIQDQCNGNCSVHLLLKQLASLCHSQSGRGN